MKLHIQPKNDKLGKIWNISLPAVETCGGMSAACAGEDGKCYVLKIYKRWPSVLTAHRNTYVNILNALEDGDDLELPSKVKDFSNKEKMCSGLKKSSGRITTRPRGYDNYELLLD